MCDKLTAIPVPHILVLLGGDEVETSGVKLSLGRESDEGNAFLCFDLISHYLSLLYLMGNILNCFPQVESVLPLTVTGK